MGSVQGRWVWVGAWVRYEGTVHEAHQSLLWPDTPLQVLMSGQTHLRPSPFQTATLLLPSMAPEDGKGSPA